MNHRLLISALVVFFAASTADSWSQESVKTAHRRESLIDLFQQRLCDMLCDCHPPTKGHHAVVKKAAVQKAPVQKGPVQKDDCRREVSDLAVACGPRSPVRVLPAVDLTPRWSGGLPQLFPRLGASSSSKGGKSAIRSVPVQRSSKACGCGADAPAPPLLPIPEIEKPQMNTNPFLDDAVQPAPFSRSSIQAATNSAPPRQRDHAVSSAHQPVVRLAAYHEVPAPVIRGCAIRHVD